MTQAQQRNAGLHDLPAEVLCAILELVPWTVVQIAGLRLLSRVFCRIVDQMATLNISASTSKFDPWVIMKRNMRRTKAIGAGSQEFIPAFLTSARRLPAMGVDEKQRRRFCPDFSVFSHIEDVRWSNLKELELVDLNIDVPLPSLTQMFVLRKLVLRGDKSGLASLCRSSDRRLFPPGLETLEVFDYPIVFSSLPTENLRVFRVEGSKIVSAVQMFQCVVGTGELRERYSRKVLGCNVLDISLFPRLTSVLLRGSSVQFCDLRGLPESHPISELALPDFCRMHLDKGSKCATRVESLA